MNDSASVEYSIISEGPGGATYMLYLPYGEEVELFISDQECAILRRCREDVLEHYALEYVQRQSSLIEHINIVRR